MRLGGSPGSGPGPGPASQSQFRFSNPVSVPASSFQSQFHFRSSFQFVAVPVPSFPIPASVSFFSCSSLSSQFPFEKLSFPFGPSRWVFSWPPLRRFLFLASSSPSHFKVTSRVPGAAQLFGFGGVRVACASPSADPLQRRRKRPEETPATTTTTTAPMGAAMPNAPVSRPTEPRADRETEPRPASRDCAEPPRRRGARRSRGKARLPPTRAAAFAGRSSRGFCARP